MAKKREPYLYYSQPIHCTDCNRQITKGGKRKYPQMPNIEMCCSICSMNNPLQRMLRELDDYLSDAERIAWKEYYKGLMAMARDLNHDPRMPEICKAKAALLMLELSKLTY